MARLLTGSLSLALAASSCCGQYIVKEIAGTRFPEGAPAISVSVGGISGIAPAPNGDIFISSYDAARIYRLNPAGQLFTYAKSPNSRVFDDLLYPMGLALDSRGNLFVASFDNNYLKRIDPLGAITTVAGNGTIGQNGGVLSVAHPSYVAVDGNDSVFVNSQIFPGIVKRDRDGNVSAPFRTPVDGVNGIAIDPSGAAYATPRTGHSIARFDLDSTSRTVAGGDLPGFTGDGGPATAAQFNYPSGLAFDPSGNLFVADSLNNKVRKISTDGAVASFANTNSMVVATDLRGNVYSTFAESRLLRFDPNGQASAIAGNGYSSYSGDGGPALTAQFDHPSGVQLDLSGNVLVVDTGNRAIRKIDGYGNVTTVIATNFAAFLLGATTLVDPTAIAFGPTGNLFIADSGLGQVLRMDADGSLTPITAQTTFNNPRSIVFDQAGNLLVAERSGNRIRKIDPAGVITTICGTGIAGFSGDGGPATDARLRFPEQITLDGAGNLYVADSGNTRVRKVDTSGIISTVASGPGSDFVSVTGVTVDETGNLFVSDRANYRVRRIDTNGAITTIAGDETNPVSAGQLTLDNAGNLYTTQGNGIYLVSR